MHFNWEEFLQKHHIEYVERGANVSRGHAAIKCPWCVDDPSAHLNISLEGKGFKCWRDPSHKGFKPHKLIVRLLHCTNQKAREIVGDQPHELTDLDTMLDGLSKKSPELKKSDNLVLPSNSYPISKTAKPFYDYLLNRGFDVPEELSPLYGLRYALTGDFAGRILLPVYMGGLQTWTARAVAANATLRYKTLGTARGELRRCSNCLYLYDNWMHGGKVLYICEGPFDALKLDYYGKDHGHRATCLFTNSMSEQQKQILIDVSDKFDKLVFVLDQGLDLRAWEMTGSLGIQNVEIRSLPTGVKDPAELSKKAALTFMGIK